MIVGWSVGVPKSLTCGGFFRGPPRRMALFSAFFLKTFFFDFLRLWVDFGRFLQAKMEAKIDSKTLSKGLGSESGESVISNNTIAF